MKNVKFNFRDVILTIVSGFLICFMFFKITEPVKPQPVVVNIPPVEGGTGYQVIQDSKPVPVYIPTKGEVIVDETYKKRYEEALDSIERMNLYYEAIQIKERTDTFINDSSLFVHGKTVTRGDLLGFDFKYKIKERQILVDPVIEVRQPKLSLYGELKAGVPTNPLSDFSLYGGIGLENQKGWGLSVGADTEERVRGGIKKSIILIK